MIFLQRILILSLMLAALGSSAWAEVDETIYTKVDENPVPLKTPPPRYPPSLRNEGISGVVAVIIVIDEKGSILTSSVAKSSNPEFEKPALEAVKSWKFKPAKKDGNPVKVRVTVPLRFNVSDS
jgi:protein TonB